MASFGDLQAILEMTGEQSIAAGADQVGDKIGGLATGIGRFSGEIARVQGQIAAVSAVMATVNMDFASIGQSIGLISKEERFQAQSVIGQMAGQYGRLGSAFAGASAGAKAGAFFGPWGSAIGTLAGSIAGGLFGEMVGPTIERIGDAVSSTFGDLFRLIDEQEFDGFFGDAIKRVFGLEERVDDLEQQINTSLNRGEIDINDPRLSAAQRFELKVQRNEEEARAGRQSLKDPILTTRRNVEAEFMRRRMDLVEDYTTQYFVGVGQDSGGINFTKIGDSFADLYDIISGFPRIEDRFEYKLNTIRNELEAKYSAFLEPQIEEMNRTLEFLDNYYGE